MEEKYMREAIKEAIKAEEKGEVPVGAVIVHDGKIISRGHIKLTFKNDDFEKQKSLMQSEFEQKKNSLCHAEIIAINKACKKMNNFRLEDCELYITLEPCLMCSGAIIQSRIKKIIYGASDEKYGMAGTVFNAFDLKSNHKVEIQSGILKEECSELLTNFFRKIREK